MEIVDILNASLAGRYAVYRQVGEGGMATVYLARDQKHERQVALKVLRPELVASMGTDRFLREIKVTAKLQHPHVLPLFDSGEADGLLYYVMPYVEGESLRERLERAKPLPISEVVRLLRDVVGGLAAAHRLGVVHQDIKPGNVLISGRRAIVADFGIARAVTQAADPQTLDLDRAHLGSPEYMAPEQAAASDHVDHRADIYAVGCLAYHMLAGQPPFHGRTRRQTLTAHVVDDVVPVQASRPSVPADLAALVMGCLEKSPVDRWQSADEVLDRLEGVATSSLGERSVRSRASGRRTVAAVAGIGVLSAVVLGVTLSVTGRSERAIPATAATSDALPRNYLAVFPFENLTGDAELDRLGTLSAYIVTDGSRRLEGMRAVSEPAVAQAMLEVESKGVVDMAEDLGAGTAVTGVFNLDGTVLEFRAEVFSVPSGELIGAVEASGPAALPLPVILELQQRTLGTLLRDVLGQERSEALSYRAPTLSALEVFLQGRSAFNATEFSRAIPLLYRAFDLDTTFVDPLAVAASANINLRRYAIADSLVSVVGSRRELLSPMGIDYLEWATALLAGDTESQLQRVRDLATTYGTNTWTYLVGNTALHAGRPNEARQALEQLTGSILEAWYFATSRLSRANHLTGRHQEALDVARRGREAFPRVLVFHELEVRALIALDRLDEAEPILEDVEAARDWQGPSPGSVLFDVATELARAGRPQEARSVGERAVTWYLARDRPAESVATAQAYVLLGRGDEALAILGPLVEGTPDSVGLRGMQGVAMALAGDIAGAERALDWLRTLDRPYLFGSATYWSAATLAHMGQDLESVRLLSRAFADGHSRLNIRADANLSPLWGLEEFERAIAPSG